MENGSNSHQHTNGKSTLIHVAQTIAPPPEVQRPGMTPANPHYSRVLDLVRDAVDLDLRLKATMNELDKEMRAVGNGDLPTVLVSLMKHHQQAHPQSPERPQLPAPKKANKPGIAKAKPRTPEPGKMPGGKWPAKIMGLLGDGKEWESGRIVKALKAPNETTIYSLLAKLHRMGYLMKPSYGVYRLKMRKL